jgi:hypothetical protein
MPPVVFIEVSYDSFGRGQHCSRNDEPSHYKYYTDGRDVVPFCLILRVYLRGVFCNNIRTDILVGRGQEASEQMMA